jgi:hypothetical protein
MGVMIVLGGIIWAVSAAYHFILENSAAIIALYFYSFTGWNIGNLSRKARRPRER